MIKGLTKDLIDGHSIFNGKKYFANDESQNYANFQSVFKHFQTVSVTDKRFVWNSKGLSKVSFENPPTSNDSFPPKLSFIYNGKVGRTFVVNCLKRQEIFLTHRNALCFLLIME